MKKKGFTLIELLAVIVILAIIALIIVPVVANIIESARFGAAKDSVLEYVHAANQYGALSLAGVSDDGLNINGTLESGVNDSELEKIKYSGTKFDYIYMEFDESNNVTNGSFCINGYSIDYNGGDVSRTIGYCNEQAGLYDENNKIVKTWDELVALGIDIETDYTTSTVTESTSGTSVLKNVLDDAKGKLILPNTITKIGSYVFYNSENLTGIRISNSVTAIGNNAFMSSGLVSIYIPGSVKSINTNAFYLTSKLHSVVLKNGIETIGNFAFGGTGDGTLSIVIPDSVTSLGTSSFESNGIKSVIIGKGITTIPAYAFSLNTLADNPNLEKVVLKGNVTLIDPHAFSNQSNLKSINLPSTLKTIKNMAFHNTGIEELTLPEGLEVITSDAFADMKSLRKLYIPSTLTSTNSSVFANATNLSDVTIGNGLKTISRSMFFGCTSLKTITLPSSIELIEASAFQYSGLESIVIPGSVKTIGNDAFRYTYDLKTLVLNEGLESIGSSAFSTREDTPSPLKSIVIPSTVTSMGQAPFNRRANLESVTFTNTTGWKINGSTAVDVTNPTTNATNIGNGSWRTATWTKN